MSSIGLFVIGSIPWTDWSKVNIGVPVLNRSLFYQWALIIATFSLSQCIYYKNISRWESGVRWKEDSSKFYSKITRYHERKPSKSQNIINKSKN